MPATPTPAPRRALRSGGEHRPCGPAHPGEPYRRRSPPGSDHWWAQITGGLSSLIEDLDLDVERPVGVERSSVPCAQGDAVLGRGRSHERVVDRTAGDPVRGQTGQETAG